MKWVTNVILDPAAVTSPEIMSDLVLIILVVQALVESFFEPKELVRMGWSLLSKGEVPGSSLLGHLPKEFSLHLTWCPWLVGYYGIRGISRGARKLARTPSLSKKKKKVFLDQRSKYQ